MPNPNGYGFSVHDNKEKCDYCGRQATMHFLSRGYKEELSQLEWWEHHLDLCQPCHEKKSRS